MSIHLRGPKLVERLAPLAVLGAPWMLKYARVKDSRRSRTSRDGGSVPRVSPITAYGASTSSAGGSAPLDFQSTDGLSNSAKNSIAKAFESASLDPQKLHHRSAQLRQLLHEAREYLDASLAPNTRRAYAVDLREFRTWCEAHGACWMPAEATTLVAYLTSLAKTHKVSSITRRLAAISVAHRFSQQKTNIIGKRMSM
ncbi:MAG: hypothetical protein EBX77_02175 [Actinobacteria bacterium]|nr:hypothetical protein [Actinomycetota bacterium]